MAYPKRVRAQAATEKSAAAKWKRVHFRDNREPSTRETPLFDRQTRRCWCGQPWQHDWLGKGDGAPHPRETRGDTPS